MHYDLPIIFNRYLVLSLYLSKVVLDNLLYLRFCFCCRTILAHDNDDVVVSSSGRINPNCISSGSDAFNIFERIRNNKHKRGASLCIGWLLDFCFIDHHNLCRKMETEVK